MKRTTIMGGYNLSQQLHELCDGLCTRITSFSHIDPVRVLFGVTSARRLGSQGVHAACHPLRFKNGALTTIVRGKCWRMPVVRIAGIEMLYYVHFYVPRFLNLGRDEKIETIVHELYHISPAFNGDLRRLGKGRHAHHGPSLASYRRLIAPLVEEACSVIDMERYAFLSSSHGQLERRFGAIHAFHIRGLRPRLMHEHTPAGIE